jgi:hypothetical protein
MDSRALHKGTANTSSTRRTLLDFAFVRERYQQEQTIVSKVRKKNSFPMGKRIICEDSVIFNFFYYLFCVSFFLFFESQMCAVNLLRVH